MTTIELPQLTFEVNGRERILNKSGKVQQALRDGTMGVGQAMSYPWYLRLDGRQIALDVNDAEAIRKAKAEMKAVSSDPVGFAAYQKEKTALRGISFEDLAEEWKESGYADKTGDVRSGEAQETQRFYIEYALRWWGKKSVAATDRSTMNTFAAARRKISAANGFKGNRQVDLELTALSSMAQWGVYAGKLDKNPFEKRMKFTKRSDVESCSEFAPDSDEQWQSVLRWFWTVEPKQEDFGTRWNVRDSIRRTRIAGAWLAFTGLTGLRPEEPQFLKRYPRLNAPPASPASLAPGTIYVARDGSVRMRVTRSKQRDKKRERNPFVTLSPVALDFLSAWEMWLDANIVKPVPVMSWFPDPEEPGNPFVSENFRFINTRLDQAAEELKLKRLKPKGFGRAFYVRVRRSAGLENLSIASELGQTGNSDLIDEVYGVSDDQVGGAQFDWLDDKGVPAWALLNPQTEATNIVQLNQAKG